MFETVAPARFYKPSRKALYEALPFSIAVHAMAGIVALLANVWTVAFPNQSPAQIVAFSVAEPPPPPPPPPLLAQPKPVQEQMPVVQKATQVQLAPTIIPDTIPEVAPTPVVAEPVIEGAVDPTEGVAGGVFGGVAQGQVGGEIGGTIGGIVGNVIPDRVVIERDKTLPMFPLSQTYPGYPENARVRLWEDSLVVRYVIGKDGRVKQVEVIQPPEHEMFVDNTVRAIRTWRFRPLIKDGKRQEVVHELTVYYRLNV
jgi:protein TonB